MKKRLVNWGVAAALTFSGLSLFAAGSATVSLLYTYDGREFKTDGRSAKAAFVVTSPSGVTEFQVAGVGGTEIGAWNGKNQVFLVDGLAVSKEFTSCTVDGEVVELVAPFKTTAAMATRNVGGKVYQSTISKGPAWWVSSDAKTMDYLPVDGDGKDKQVTASRAGWSVFTDGDYDVFAWPETVLCNGRRYVLFRYAVRTKDTASAPNAAKCAIGAKLQLNSNLKVVAGLSGYGWLVRQASGLTPYMNLGIFTRKGNDGVIEKIDRLSSAMWFGTVETGKTLADHAFDNTTDPYIVGQLNPGHVAVSWQDLDLSSGDVQTMSVAFGNFDAEVMEEDAGKPYVSYTAEGWEGTYDGRPHGISVTALDPTDATVQYALKEEGPYRDDPYAFTDVNETPIDVWFRLEAEGYATVTNFAGVVIHREGGEEEPGSGDVPPGGLSRFDASAVYDGLGHTFDTNGLTAAYRERVLNPPLTYSLAENGPWTAAAPSFTNAGEHVCWYRYGSEDNPNVKLFKHPAKVTISPRAVKLTSGTQSWPYDGEAHSNVTVTVEGTFAAGEGVTTNGFAMIADVGEKPNSFEYELILNPGSILENYAVTCVTGTLAIVTPPRAELAAEIAWKYLKASGTYMAQLKVTCTSGSSAGIGDLRFMFADRVSDGVTYASLWDTPRRAAKSTTMSYKGDMYRYVALDPSKITAENVPVTYGVSNLSASSIPTAERTIELYVRKRVNPTAGNEEVAEVESFVGYVGWTSGGETTYLPVVAGARAASLARANVTASSPMKVSALNAALAVGAAVTDDSSPYCRLSEFSVEGNVICGRVEVGAVSADGKESAGTLGPNVAVSLLGAPTLGCDFRPLGTVKTDDAGRFRVVKPDDCRFYRLRLTVEEVVQ